MSNFIGWDFFEGLISWVMGYNQNEINYNRQVAENQKNRDFTAQQTAQAQAFNAKQAELSYDRMEEFYEKHQSLPARMREYEQAGMNPVLAAGASPVSPASVPSASSSPAGASTSALPQVMDLANMILNIKEKQADIIGKDIDNDNKQRAYDDAHHLSVLEGEAKKAAADRDYMTIVHMQKDIEVKDKEIEIGNSVIEVNLSQRDLNIAKTKLENLNSKQIEELMPLMIEYQAEQNENLRADTANKIAQKLLIESETTATDTGTVVNSIATGIDAVSDVVTTVDLIIEGAAEIFGFSETLNKARSMTTVRDRKGNVVRTVERSSSGSGSKSSTKKRRRKR